MKWRTRIKFANDFINGKRGYFWTEVILLIMGFSVLTYALFITESRHRFKYQIERIMNGDVDSIGIAEFNNKGINTEKKYEKYLHNVKRLSREFSDMEEIDVFFNLDNAYSGAPIKELRDLQKKYISEEGVVPLGDSFCAYYTQPDVLKLDSINLYSGDKVSYDDFEIYRSEYPEAKEIIFVYAGYDYKDESLDDVFFMDDDEKHEYPFVVKGVLDKNTCIVGDLGFGDYEYEQSSYINMNYYYLMICQEDINRAIIKVRDGLTIEDTKELIKNKAKEYGLDIRIFLLKNEIDKSEHRVNKKVKILDKMFFMIAIVSVCSILCLQTIGVMNNRKKHGILLSNGAATHDLVIIEIIEGLIKLIFSSVISIAISFPIIFVVYGYVFVDSDKVALVNLILKSVLWKAVLINSILMVVGLSVPLFSIIRKKPVYLIKETLE